MKKLFTFLAVMAVAAVATVWAAETYTTVTNRGQVITVKKYTDMATQTADLTVFQDNSEYAVKAELLSEGRDGMCGHNHRNAMWQRTTQGRRPLTWWHIGCLCKTDPEYMKCDDQVANWQQGQAFITEYPARAAVELVPIHRGVAYWRGRRYEA
jgi:hypothetical protein